MSEPATAPAPRATDPVTRVALIVLAVVNLVVGLTMAVAPDFFYDFIGVFGPLNEHGMYSYATWALALSAVLFIALSRPNWQVPVLAVTALQGVLHTAITLIDLESARPAFYGPLTAALVALPTLLALWALWRFLRYPLS